jgi:hypothetical protein
MTTQRGATSIALATQLTSTALMATAPPVSAANACPDIDAVAVPGTTQTDPHADPDKPVGILEPLKRRSHRAAHARALSTYYTVT